MLWKVYGGLVLGIVIALFYPVHLVLLSHRPWFPIAFRLMRFQSFLILTLIGIVSRVKYEGKLPNGPFIICPNHTSYIDILVMYRIFKRYFVFMGKMELAEMPLLNLFFKRMNVLVDRDSKMAAVRALQATSEEIDKGHSVVIFPEGTIPNTTPKMKSFKNGPFKLAIQKQVPIVPVTFLNNYKLLQIGAFFRQNGRPGIARVVVNKTISTKGMNDQDLIPLRQQVFDVIEKTQDHYENR